MSVMRTPWRAGDDRGRVLQAVGRVRHRVPQAAGVVCLQKVVVFHAVALSGLASRRANGALPKRRNVGGIAPPQSPVISCRRTGDFTSALALQGWRHPRCRGCHGQRTAALARASNSGTAMLLTSASNAAGAFGKTLARAPRQAGAEVRGVSFGWPVKPGQRVRQDRVRAAHRAERPAPPSPEDVA